MKAILVIDMPEACADGCPVMCRARGINHRPTWCPLRPLPEKIDISEDELYEKQYMCFEGGWNACLDEITGETE